MTTQKTEETQDETKATPKKPAAAEKKKVTEASEHDDGIAYKFAKTTDMAVPMVPFGNIVLSDFDSRAAGAEPDDEFLADVKEKGILQPIPVAALDDGKWLLIAGRRRYKAAKALGLKTVPIAPRVISDDAGAEGLTAKDKAELMCLSENLHRLDLNGWDLAVQMRHFKDNKGWSQTRIAKLLNRKDPFVSQYLSIFELDKRVQRIIQSNASDGGVISKARLLKRIKDPDQQYAVAQECFNKKDPWTTNQLTEVVEGIVLKELEREKREKEKAEAKEKGAKTRKSSDGEGDGAESGPIAASEFEGASIELKVAAARKLGELIQGRFEKAKIRLAEAPAKERAAASEKLAYERGALDTIKQMMGLKAAPKSVVGE